MKILWSHDMNFSPASRGGTQSCISREKKILH